MQLGTDDQSVRAVKTIINKRRTETLRISHVSRKEDAKLLQNVSSFSFNFVYLKYICRTLQIKAMMFVSL